MIHDFVLNEYKARQLWERREYEAAMGRAQLAATAALEHGDESGWWRMTFLCGECQLELGQMDACAETAKSLTEHVLTLGDPELAAKAKALRSAGLRASGQLHQALEVAREAALDLPESEIESKGKLDAQQVLVAVLAESGNLEDAWAEATALASMIGSDTTPEKAGKAYWSIGNVAFLMGRNREATHYHGMAADCLSPSNDVALWALFNKASAFMRLSANLVEPETLQCIERAEMAISISGGTEQDALDTTMIRAYWRFLTGETEGAKTEMEWVLGNSDSMAPLSHGDAALLYARIVAAVGMETEAVRHALVSAELFDRAGAPVRAKQARDFAGKVSPLNVLHRTRDESLTAGILDQGIY